MTKHFLQDRLGKVVKVPQINKPIPKTPEKQTSIHLHRSRAFALRQLAKKDMEGQDYQDE